MVRYIFIFVACIAFAKPWVLVGYPEFIEKHQIEHCRSLENPYDCFLSVQGIASVNFYKNEMFVTHYELIARVPIAKIGDDYIDAKGVIFHINEMPQHASLPVLNMSHDNVPKAVKIIQLIRQLKFPKVISIVVGSSDQWRIWLSNGNELRIGSRPIQTLPRAAAFIRGNKLLFKKENMYYDFRNSHQVAIAQLNKLEANRYE
jgi:hypothetical protein